ncbi:MAG: hypothetical protein RR957_00875 [Oscillospiraceae bacterium]
MKNIANNYLERENEKNDDLEFELFLEELRGLPKDCTPMAFNLPRLKDAMFAYEVLDKVVKDMGSQSKISCRMDDRFGTGTCYIGVDVDIFIVKNELLRELMNSMNTATTLEIVPLTNGKISIGLSFNEVMIPTKE